MLNSSERETNESLLRKSRSGSLFQTDNSWSIKKQELENSLKTLSMEKQDLLFRKESVEKMRSKALRITQKDASIEELRMLLEISHEQSKDYSNALTFERKSKQEMEEYLQSVKNRYDELEKFNKSLSTRISNKDKHISYCVSDLYKLKSKIEKIGNSAISTNIQMEIEGIIEKLSTDDYFNFEEKKTLKTPTKSAGKSFNFGDSNISNMSMSSNTESNAKLTEEISSLRRQLQETQELYHIVSEQLRERNDKGIRYDEEISVLRNKLQEARREYDTLTSQLVKQSTDRDFQHKNLLIEIEELKKKRNEQEIEVKKLETNYKTNISELETSLSTSRERFLQLLEDKSKLESDSLQMRAEKKELINQLQIKEMKINELSASIQGLSQELGLLKKHLNLDDVDIGQLRNLSQKTQNLEEQLEQAKQALSASKSREELMMQEIDDLSEKLEIYESCPTINSESVLKQLSQQISSIILSKDKAFAIDPKIKSLLKQVFGENCVRLMDNYEEIVKSVHQDKNQLKDRLLYEIELRAQCLIETQKSFDMILEYKGRDKDIENKRKQITEELKHIEKQISIEESAQNMYKVDSPTQNKQRNDFKLKDEVENLKGENEKLKSDINSYEKEQSQLNEELNKSTILIEQLKKKISKAMVNVNKDDLVGFLQCEAAALEETLTGNQNYFGNESFAEL
ncbi:unnamed protein product [Blepharisma stoltei]|uniref:Uncharacterized protein n=1 Tax=Blepharisma stoltei TaxID=1481888 RepID=A0AAU9IIU8_9CILI|nr:unnamed protein product [Blepharisma stoltei]